MQPHRNLVVAFCTGKSFSEVLILASANPQYDKRLSIDLPVQYIKIPSLEHGENMGRTCCLHKLFWMSKQKQKTIFVHSMFSSCSPHVRPMIWAWNFHVLNNLLSYRGLVDAKIASDIDLPVCRRLYSTSNSISMVFCFQNSFDLLWEKMVLVIEIYFWSSRRKAKNLQKICQYYFQNRMFF